MNTQLKKTPGLLPLTLTEGDSLTLDIIFAGIDLTGYTFLAAAYDARGEKLADFTVTVDPGNAQLLHVSLDDVTALHSTGARWHLQWTAPGDAEVRTVLAGPITVVPK